MDVKNLLIIRHAKSGWDSPNLKDHDRPLNDRGNKDAPMMAKRLLDKNISIDAFVSSTAVRALATATFFHEVFKGAKEQLIKIPELYHAAPAVFYSVVSALDDHYKTVAIFSHNPGITDFVNSLDVAKVDDMPTCGIFGIHAEVKSWKDFAAAEKRFWLLDYPKL